MLVLNNIFSWISVNSTIISLFATLTLVFITGVYVYFTKKILDSAVRQSNLISNPVIGIQIKSMEIGVTWSNNRRMLGIKPQLINLGNAPAINVLVDAEILLEYSNILGEKVIPARFEPGIISFIRPGEEINDKSVYLEFGNTSVASLLDDFREQHRLNVYRVNTDPTVKPYEASKLRICLFYMNNLGQYFESNYETFLRLDDIPNDDETAELLNAPRLSKFYAGPIYKNEMDKKISNRKNKRELSGW